MTQQIVRVTDSSTPDDIKAAIKLLRLKQERMPQHWTERRAEVGDEIDALVTRLLNHH